MARIALVKPDKAKGVENMVLQMAQRGQLNEKVTFTAILLHVESSQVSVHLGLQSAIHNAYSHPACVLRNSC